MKCPDIETLQALATGNLSPAMRDEIYSHTTSCDVCQRRKSETNSTFLTADPEKNNVTTIDPDDLQVLLKDLQAIPMKIRIEQNTERELPVVNGFKITKWLGGCGMDDVYRATQLRPEREVAIKFLRHSTRMNNTELE